MCEVDINKSVIALTTLIVYRQILNSSRCDHLLLFLLLDYNVFDYTATQFNYALSKKKIKIYSKLRSIYTRVINADAKYK